MMEHGDQRNNDNTSKVFLYVQTSLGLVAGMEESARYQQLLNKYSNTGIVDVLQYIASDLLAQVIKIVPESVCKVISSYTCMDSFILLTCKHDNLLLSHSVGILFQGANAKDVPTDLEQWFRYLERQCFEDKKDEIVLVRVTRNGDKWSNRMLEFRAAWSEWNCYQEVPLLQKSFYRVRLSHCYAMLRYTWHPNNTVGFLYFEKIPRYPVTLSSRPNEQVRITHSEIHLLRFSWSFDARPVRILTIHWALWDPYRCGTMKHEVTKRTQALVLFFDRNECVSYTDRDTRELFVGRPVLWIQSLKPVLSFDVSTFVLHR